ncbi:ABC transporter for cobalamin/Fe3+-siderophores ATP-binding protein [Psychromonas sp. CNPT3]|uniref:ABC transporter ATP-binding protein n=1 Tax=Psychromonas sp. CNPT3 TaxID=314282 RepID=UPI00006E956F|nr:ABC transporter ATP-binding protein [Psychromonas sp. CNPT3]AGH80266.1 ABC transporter for cobalamin/Fe3+-siderophores ATP-binding protein [Psychromonas sp. CNPT3]
MHQLHCENIRFSYAKSPLFKDLDIHFNKAQFVGLIGANGAGKSTLLKLMLGALSPQSGRVLLNQQSLDKQARRDIAKQMAFVPQSIALPYAFSVQQIVAMGRNPYLSAFSLETKHDKEQIALAMQQTDITHLQSRLVNTLSGGEKQRVIIARALAQQADIILFDEPIANLDICHQIETLRLIKTLTTQGKLAICALHDLNFASKYCDRLILIGKHKEGSQACVIADGKPEQVLTDENLAQQFSITADRTTIDNKLFLSNMSPI